MELILPYLFMVIGCWCILMEPQLRICTVGRCNFLAVHIENLWPAVLRASLYTLPVALAVRGSKPKKAEKYNNYSWIIMIPYIMYCIYVFGISLSNMRCQLMSEDVRATQNFGRVLAKIVFVYCIQLFFILETAVVMVYVKCLGVGWGGILLRAGASSNNN